MHPLITNILSVAKAVAPIARTVPGVAAAEAVMNLIVEAKETIAATPEQVAKLEESRAELEQAILSHADATAASLGD